MSIQTHRPALPLTLTQETLQKTLSHISAHIVVSPLAYFIVGAVVCLALSLSFSVCVQAQDLNSLPRDVYVNTATVSSTTTYPPADLKHPSGNAINKNPGYPPNPLSAEQMEVLLKQYEWDTPPQGATLVKDSPAHYTLTLKDFSQSFMFYAQRRFSYGADNTYYNYSIAIDGAQKTLVEPERVKDILYQNPSTSLDGSSKVGWGYAKDHVEQNTFARRFNLPSANKWAHDIEVQLGFAAWDFDDTTVNLLKTSPDALSWLNATQLFRSTIAFEDNESTEDKPPKSVSAGTNLREYYRTLAIQRGARGYVVRPYTTYSNIIVLKKGAPGVDIPAAGKSTSYIGERKRAQEPYQEDQDFYYVDLHEEFAKITMAYSHGNYYAGSVLEDQYGIASNDVLFQTRTYTRNKYSLFYDFSEKDLYDAWAAEVSYNNRWSYYQEHYLKNNYFSPGVSSYNMQVTEPARYSYHFDKPGTYAITVTGHNGWSGSYTATLEVKEERPTDTTTPPSSDNTITLYRLYNPLSSEHLFTASKYEADVLSASHGWNFEGVAWNAPKKSERPVYRLYNRISGEHFYTTSATEVQYLTTHSDWNYEGILCYSADDSAMPIYRVYQPRLRFGHHFSSSSFEINTLIHKHGWKSEGIAWYGLR